MNQRYIPALLAVLATTLLNPNECSAFGKPKPVDNTPPPPVILQAVPFRYMELAHVTVPTFFLPNGTRVDFNADLDKIFDTSINSSRYMRSQISTPEHKSRLVITGGITSFEMDILQLNAKIGWNKTGPIQIGIDPNYQASIDLRLSSLSMDFKIYDRNTGETYTAEYTDQSLANLKLEVKINLADVGAGVELLYKAKIAETLRLGMLDLLTRIENKQSFNLIPWQALVLGVDTSRNTVVFGAGIVAGIKANDAYTIYAGCDQQEQINCFERFLADVKVANSGNNSSEAAPLTSNDSLGNIRAGDKVYVKILANPNGN